MLREKVETAKYEKANKVGWILHKERLRIKQVYEELTNEGIFFFSG
jgi:hypothetical protein